MNNHPLSADKNHVTDHDNRHGATQLEIRFIKSLILNSCLAIGEIAMSIITGSTALLADGLNNIDDVAALLLSIFSERKAQQGPNERHTFGYKRMDALAGFAKGLLLLASAFFVLIQAVNFVFTPQSIDGVTVLIVGGIALIINLLSALWLKQDACSSLNARGTYYCMVYDAFGSLSVIISGILSMMFNFQYFDVIASLIITFLMIKAGWNILRECILLFMQSVPEHFNIDDFEQAVLQVEHVSSIGDIHVWSLTPTEHHLTCKISVEIQDACKCHNILQTIEGICRKRFNIQHTTIQLVYSSDKLQTLCASS